MDNQEIRDMIRRKANDIPVPDSLEPDQIEKKIEDAKQFKPFLTKRIRTILATAASLAVICAAGFGLRPLFFSDSEYNSSSDSIVEQRTVAESPEKNDTTYEEICDAINDYNSTALRMFEESSYDYSGGTIPKGIMNNSEADTVAEENAGTQKSSSEDSTESSYQAEEGDYSETDTQVNGVMEGDIVKTDGKHIFTIKDSTTGCTVTIYEAQSADVKELSHFTISQADCREMYIEGTTLILTGNLWDDGIPSQNDTDFEEYEEYYSPARKTHITLYDISDPAAPKGIRQHSQSGEYNTSRISDGYLYTFTNYEIYASENYNEKEPEKFVPELNGTIMKSGDIRLLDKDGADSYMVMTSLNISDNGKFADSKAVLERFDTYYMNQNHIYAVSLDYSPTTRSTIIKYAYDKGIFSFQGSTKIRGEIKDSYYMHEYKDNFVFVYTRDSKKITNGLCVMDKDLKLMGEISDLGVNETIYASYFIDNMAYFVTYRNTDPVFAVDISNPAKPVLKSELKLPGFSSYLHSFGDNMLIGIGQEDQASIENDVEVLGERVKLSLFSISKDYKLREIDKKLAAQDTTSYAGTNHKSIFVDEERSLIGLGIDRENPMAKDTYDIYQCRKGKLKKVLSVPLKDSTDIYYVRGLRIGEYFYIVDTMGGIKVYDINTWKKAK